jgi:RNA polymerase sigma-70 factor (ECF subfamily)
MADVSRAPTRSVEEPLPTDAELIRRVLSGGGEAYALLVQRHQGALFRHARAIGLDADTAADMVQDALVRAYERLGSCRDPGRFGIWIGRILRNRCLDHVKSPAARAHAPLHAALRAEHGDPERDEERASIRHALEAALASLPAEQREAFLLKHAEDRSYEEMAEMAGCSVSALKMRVHRARERLRERITVAGLRDPM